jgi:hypothetical protein
MPGYRLTSPNLDCLSGWPLGMSVHSKAVEQKTLSAPLWMLYLIHPELNRNGTGKR